jgi:hypothetical protein
MALYDVTSAEPGAFGCGSGEKALFVELLGLEDDELMGIEVGKIKYIRVL